MPKNHILKLESIFFKDVIIGKKLFEIRFNDRDFKVGDYVTFYEVVNGIRTGVSSWEYKIIFIMHGGIYGISKGYCVFNW